MQLQLYEKLTSVDDTLVNVGKRLAAQIAPGDSLGPDAAAAGTFAVKTAAASVTLGDNGGMMALGYGIATEKVPVLINAFFAVAE